MSDGGESCRVWGAPDNACSACLGDALAALRVQASQPARRSPIGNRSISADYVAAWVRRLCTFQRFTSSSGWRECGFGEGDSPIIWTSSATLLLRSNIQCDPCRPHSPHASFPLGGCDAVGTALSAESERLTGTQRLLSCCTIFLPHSGP